MKVFMILDPDGHVFTDTLFYDKPEAEKYLKDDIVKNHPWTVNHNPQILENTISEYRFKEMHLNTWECNGNH